MFCRRIRSCLPRPEARQLWRTFGMATPLQCPEVRSCRRGICQGPHRIKGRNMKTHDEWLVTQCVHVDVVLPCEHER